MFSQLEKSNANLAAYIYAIFGNFCFVYCDSQIRKHNDIPVFQFMHFLNIMHALVSFSLIKILKIPLLLNNPKINKKLVLSGCISIVTRAALTYGLQNLPFQNSLIIYQTYPGICCILASFILKEKYGISEFLISSLSMGGLIIILKPAFLFGVSEQQSMPIGIETPDEPQNFALGYFCIILAAICSSCGIILSKILQSQKVETLHLMLNGAVMIGSFSGFGLISGDRVVTLNWDQFFGLAQAACFQYVAGFLMTRSYRFGNAGKIALISYSQIFYTFVLSVLFLEEELDILSVIGAAVIFSCIFVQIYDVVKKSRSKTQDLDTSPIENSRSEHKQQEQSQEQEQQCQMRKK